MFKKGFISPLVDDLPTLIFVIICITIFFYILDFCLNIYKEKIEMYNFNRYNIMLTSNLLSNGILSDHIFKNQKKKIQNFAQSIGYNFDACLESEDCCDPNSINEKNRFIVSKYVVPWYVGETIVPRVIKVCMW